VASTAGGAFGFASGLIIQEFGYDDDVDDDLTDLLMDAQANLDGAGLIWVLTPKARTTGAVQAAEVEEAAATAGMHATSAASMGQHWSGIRVSSRGR